MPTPEETFEIYYEQSRKEYGKLQIAKHVTNKLTTNKWKDQHY